MPSKEKDVNKDYEKLLKMDLIQELKTKLNPKKEATYEDIELIRL